MVTEITDSNFETEVGEGLTIIDFWAEWCGPCRMISPIIEQIAEENPDIKVGKVNVDFNQDLSTKYNIRSIPTILFIKGNEIVDKVVGAVPKDRIQAVVDTHK